MFEDRWKDVEVKEGEKRKGGNWEPMQGSKRKINQEGFLKTFLSRRTT